jgi:hypothetical protein
MTATSSPWLSAYKADEYLGRRHGTVSRLCKAGVIPSKKVGHTRYVRTDWLDEWMMGHPDGALPTFSALRPSSR